MKTSLFVTTLVSMTLAIGSLAHAADQAPALPPVKIIAAGAVVKKAAPEMKVEAKTETKVEDKKTSDFDDSSQLPSAPAKKLAPVKIVRTGHNATHARVQPRPVVTVTREDRQGKALPVIDQAALIVRACSARAKYKIGCMNRAIERAEAQRDREAVRVANCGQLRKVESQNPAATEATVFTMLGRVAVESRNAFATEMSSAGKVTVRGAREIELRAKIKEMKATSALADQVCSAPEFAKLTSK